MWLRIPHRVTHYLPVAKTSEVVREAIRGLILRQMDLILYDPYANSFNLEENDQHWDEDKPKQKPAVWEQKYEIDSLCFPFFLLDRYLEIVGDESLLAEPRVQAAWATVIRLWTLEQDHAAKSHYYFIREDCPPQDTISHGGKGHPVAEGTGLTWCGFRPSDDACTYPFLIPSNLFAAHILEVMAEHFPESDAAIELTGPAQRYAETGADLEAGPEKGDGFVPEEGGYASGEFAARTLADEPTLKELKAQALQLAKEIRAGVEKVAIAQHPIYGDVYCYETDGQGKQLLMDDANIPSLLSLPFLGVLPKDDERYRRTRKLILSDVNPYYYEGKVARDRFASHAGRLYLAHCFECAVLDFF